MAARVELTAAETYRLMVVRSRFERAAEAMAEAQQNYDEARGVMDGVVKQVLESHRVELTGSRFRFTCSDEGAPMLIEEPADAADLSVRKEVPPGEPAP